MQYSVTVALSYDEIKKDPQRITKIKLVINKYIWEGINVSSEKNGWKKFEKNNVTNALNVLYAKKQKNISYLIICFKHNSNRAKQVSLLVILNGEKRERSKTLATRAKSKGCETKSEGRRR